MSSLSAAQQYIAFLEEDFAKDPQEVKEQKTPQEHSLENYHRWRNAAEKIQPRSKMGFLFGVTDQDISRARQLLEGIPVPSRATVAIKRTMDIVLSLLGIMVLLPVFILLTILIKMDSPGPAIFRQERIGVDGEKFRMLKFRTMHERTLHERTVDEPAVLFRLQQDPRITKVGRFLRRYSLDEIPQLFNVLRGDMSLVGPRPRLEIENINSDWERSDLVMKPGITGLWAIGRSTLSWSESKRLDIYYAENWSLVLDVRLMFRVILYSLRRTGAY